MRLNFKVTNKEAKYEVVLARLEIAKVSREQEEKIKAYSHVVVGQITVEYLVNGQKLIKYLH